MAIVSSGKEQAIEAVDEFLLAAKICISTAKPTGGHLGYAAALLLLCAADAIGNGVLKPGKSTRLDILLQSPFDLPLLKQGHVENLENWYRNALAHSGVIAPGACMTDLDGDEPFEFDLADQLVKVHVPAFYKVVHEAWDRLDKATDFNPPARHSTPEAANRSEGFGSSLSPAASGVV